MADGAVGGTKARDPFVDFVRAFSLLVVIAWHWIFTIVIWRPDGPHASNPIGFTRGLWLLTWVFQVMPLFFFVGGYAHLTAWDAARTRGQRLASFVYVRIKHLALPALALLITWSVAGIVLGQLFTLPWIGRAVRLVVSPLWFMAVYLLLVVMLPVSLWLHRRFDVVALVWMGGLAALVDVGRFKYHHSWLGWFNMILVWGLCHQLGFFYERIVALRRQADWALMFGGLFALIGLVVSNLYPGSMVGVPGERLSNMAPPTMCIVALAAFQAGLAEVLRPSVSARLARRRWARVNDVINRFSLPLFLFHSTGMAFSRAFARTVLGRNEATRPDLWWWLKRPVAFVGPLLFTLPVIFVFGRRWTRRRPVPAAGVPAVR
jgi:Acyltransferase family